MRCTCQQSFRVARGLARTTRTSGGSGGFTPRRLPAQERRTGNDPIMARAILQDLSDGLNIRALEVHRRRSKHSGQVAFGTSGELKSSRCNADTRGGQEKNEVGKKLYTKSSSSRHVNHPHVQKQPS